MGAFGVGKHFQLNVCMVARRESLQRPCFILISKVSELDPAVKQQVIRTLFYSNYALGP